jgi:hypothetical protein
MCVYLSVRYCLVKLYFAVPIYCFMVSVSQEFWHSLAGCSHGLGPHIGQIQGFGQCWVLTGEESLPSTVHCGLLATLSSWPCGHFYRVAYFIKPGR